MWTRAATRCLTQCLCRSYADPQCRNSRPASLCHCRVESKRGRIRNMRTVVALVCSIALECTARGEKKEQKKEAKHGKTPQHVTRHSEHTEAKRAPVQYTHALQHVASPKAQPASTSVPADGN